MWLFLSDGFLSIVADRDSKDKLLVRSRVAGHIEAVSPSAVVFQDAGSDYQYRALINRKTVSLAVAKQLEGIVYDNFKDSVREPRYHSACMNVWMAMHSLQQRGIEHIDKGAK